MNAIGFLLCALGGFFILANLACLIYRRSLVPPLGGVLFVAGLLFLPEWRHLWWLCLIIDAGFWMILFATPDLIAGYRRSSPSRLHLALCGTFDGIEVRLSLFQPDYYEIRLSRLSPLTEPSWQSRGSLGTWTCRGQRTELISHTDTPESPSRAVLTHFPDYDYYEVTESTFSAPAGFTAPEYPPIHFRFDGTSKPNG
jgi:hypothetical protein